MTTEELLFQFNIDPQNRKIRDYYEADNLWFTLKINNDENSHSAFIAWLLGTEPTKPNSPLYNFFNLLVQRKESDIELKGYQDFKRAVLLGTLKLESLPIFEPEKVVSKLSRIRYNDRIDIYATCDISGVGEYKQLEIFIENKICSSEGGDKFSDLVNPTQEEIHYKSLQQTERYYYACSKENGLRNASFQNDNTLQLFVFLTPQQEQTPVDKKHYIKISYQDLVDFIIEPLLNREDLDNHTVFVLKEYLRMLGNLKNKITMATVKEERELLKEFYTKNEDLFRRALEVMSNDSESPEEDKLNYKEMLDSIAARKSTRRYFKISGRSKKYKMYEVVAEFTKHLLEHHNMQLSGIEELIKEFTNEPKRNHISDCVEGVFRYDKHYHSDNYKGTPFYVTKEWGYVSSSDSNFAGFLKKVNAKYADFQIEEITQ